jgi:nucleoside-diphosphate-sugar epimerase
VFNLGSGNPLSINQLAKRAIAAHGLPPSGHGVNYALTRPGEQRRVQADIRYAREVLGWEPRTSFEEGLLATMRWAGNDEEALCSACAGPGREAQ